MRVHTCDAMTVNMTTSDDKTSIVGRDSSSVFFAIDIEMVQAEDDAYDGG